MLLVFPSVSVALHLPLFSWPPGVFEEKSKWTLSQHPALTRTSCPRSLYLWVSPPLIKQGKSQQSPCFWRREWKTYYTKKIKEKGEWWWADQTGQDIEPSHFLCLAIKSHSLDSQHCDIFFLLSHHCPVCLRIQYLLLVDCMYIFNCRYDNAKKTVWLVIITTLVLLFSSIANNTNEPMIVWPFSCDLI